RPGLAGRLPLKPRLDLLRPEVREPLPHRDHPLRQLFRRRMRAARRRVAALLEPPRRPGLAPTPPDVERLPGDPVPTAQVADREGPALVLPKQHDTLFHPTGLLEGHRSFSPNRATPVTC